MIYIDTSVLVPLFANEPSSQAVSAWAGERAADARFAVSQWCLTEFWSAISIKVRSKKISEQQRNSVIRALEENLWLFEIVPFDEIYFEHARRLMMPSQNELRSGDALHLAIVISEGAELCTRDIGLARSAAKWQVKTHEL